MILWIRIYNVEREREKFAVKYTHISNLIQHEIHVVLTIMSRKGLNVINFYEG
jgi:hypothetical protein